MRASSSIPTSKSFLRGLWAAEDMKAGALLKDGRLTGESRRRIERELV